ncbi:hypothetical protein FOZ60_006564, partial [Perkinsus olseni]
AFVDLKQALVGLPSLDYPDFSRPFQIASDASDYAMGGVLQQDDHRPLQWLEKATSQKLQRWLLALQQYKFTVVYVPASKNAVADALSRVRLDPSMTGDKSVTQAQLSASGLIERGHLHVPGVHAVVLTPAFSFADLLEAQKNDDILSQVASRVQDDAPLSRTELKGPDFISYKRVWKTLDVCDGLLVREVRPSAYSGPIWVPVVPTSLRCPMIRRFHDDVGHVGAPRLLDKVQTLAYWPCMAEDIEKYVSSCDGCLNSKKSKPPPAPLMPVPIGRPWETVAVDLLTVPKNADGISTLLVLQDYFTKWAHVVPLKEHTWADVARPLYHLFLLFGPPLRLHSDQGPPFESWMFKFVLGLLGVKKSRSSVYHPIGNGLVERFNQTFLKMLRVHVETTHDWYQHLGSLVWFYNTSIHSSTKASPFYLMYGREPPDLWFPSLGQVQNMLFDPEAFARYISHTRATIQDKVNECVTQAAMSYKASYNAKSRERQFRPGMRVRMETLGLARANKLSPRWEGEWYVLKALPNLENKTVEVIHPATNRVKVISVDHLLIDPIQPEEVPIVVLDLLRQETTSSSSESSVVRDLPYQHGPEVPIVAEYVDSRVGPSLAQGTGPQDPEVQSTGSSSERQRSSAPASVDGARLDGAEEVEGIVADYDDDGHSGSGSQGSQALRSALGSDVQDFVSVNQSDLVSSLASEESGLSANESAQPHSTSSSSSAPSPVVGEDRDLGGEESDGVRSNAEGVESNEESSSAEEAAEVPPHDWSLARDRPRREVRPPKRLNL